MGENREKFRKPKTIKMDVINRAIRTLSLSNDYVLVVTAFVSYPLNINT